MKRMKKIIVMLVMVLGLASSASAKKIALNAYDKTSGYRETCYWIDREANRFFFDADSDEEKIIKNYKKSGNKETFTIYNLDNPSQCEGSVEIVVDPSLTKKDDLSGQYIIVKQSHYTYNYNVKLDSQEENSRGGGGSSPREAVKDKVVDGAKNLFEKSKDLFKKKDKQTKDEGKN